MISNLYTSNQQQASYPLLEKRLAFSDYIALCKNLIQTRRTDLSENTSQAKLIIDANSPFELKPSAHQTAEYGVLLIHGLLDCPFSMLDIGRYLQENGILVRSVLLPGHGTTPQDLHSVSYHDWVRTVQYGVEALRKETNKIFLIGYSTGAALSLYHTLHDPSIAGIMMVAPALKVKAPVDIVVNWHHLLKFFTGHSDWIYREKEIDYTKYLSIPFNAVAQLTKLMQEVNKLKPLEHLSCPIFIALSREDETISSKAAIDFFGKLKNKKNKLLLYSLNHYNSSDSRVMVRRNLYQNLHIKHFSHVSLPFAPTNPHYGQISDYSYASQIDMSDVIYGAYNRIEVDLYEFLYKLHLIKIRRRELTYNPDFEFTAEQIKDFIVSLKETNPKSI